jgi:hypothetical protein
MSELASPALNESSNGGSLNFSGEAAHDSAAHLLAQISSNDSQVQNLPGGDAVQTVINPLGEYSKPATVRNHVSVVELSLLPKLFWSFEPTEFHQAITAKIPALEQNLDVSNFVNFNLSVQTFLATIDSAGLGDVYTVTFQRYANKNASPRNFFCCCDAIVLQTFGKFNWFLIQSSRSKSCKFISDDYHR